MSAVFRPRFWAKASPGSDSTHSASTKILFLDIGLHDPNLNRRSGVQECFCKQIAPDLLASCERFLSVFVHDEIKYVAARPHAVEGQRRERLVDDVELRQEVVLVGLDVENPGRKLAAA